MKDFSFIGEPAGLVLGRLGLPQDTLIKIRRKISSGVLRQMSKCIEENTNRHLPGGVARMASSASITKANYQTFKAESMYSYRIRAECLWGKREEQGDNADNTVPSAVEQSLLRKRWVSDADADGPMTAPGSRPSTNIGREPMTNCGELPLTDTYTDIYPVSSAEPVQAGDVLFLSCAQATMVDFQAITVSQQLKGLKFLDVSALDLPGHGTEFFEVVLSGHNHFVGRSPGRDNSAFAAYYGCSVVAVRRRGSAEATSTVPPPISRTVSNSSAAQLSSREFVTDAVEVQVEEGLEPAFDSNTGSSSLMVEGRGVAEAVALLARRPMSTGHSPRPFAAAPSPLDSAGASLNTAKSGVSTPVGGWSRNSGITRTRATSSATEEARAIEVAQRSFKAGDVILVLAEEEFMDKFASSKDFFLVTKVGSVPKPVQAFDYLALLVFVAMLTVVVLGIDMVSA